MQLSHYLGLLKRSEASLADAYGEMIEQHKQEVAFFYVAQTLRKECLERSEKLKPFVEKYGDADEDEPDRLHSTLFSGTRSGPLAYLRDLHDLYLMATECDITWTLVEQAAKGLRDEDLISVISECESETAMQVKFLTTRMKAAATQSLIVS